MIRIAAILIALSLSTFGPALAAPAVEEAWYVVRAGDTLFGIARTFGVEVADLRAASELHGDRIEAGGRLCVPRPFRRTSVHDIVWRRPLSRRPGEVLRAFGPYREGDLELQHSGVSVPCPAGTEVLAPAHGVVRFAGEQPGWGALVILGHGARNLTVLGPLDATTLTVAEGQLVRVGDPLGRTMPAPDGGRDHLYLEWRRRGVAIDPSRLLD